MICKPFVRIRDMLTMLTLLLICCDIKSDQLKCLACCETSYCYNDPQGLPLATFFLYHLFARNLFPHRTVYNFGDLVGRNSIFKLSGSSSPLCIWLAGCPYRMAMGILKLNNLRCSRTLHPNMHHLARALHSCDLLLVQ